MNGEERLAIHLARSTAVQYWLAQCQSKSLAVKV